ncbi:MAG: hypothetical protein AAF449_17120 [Myxococcota bacterium]
MLVLAAVASKSDPGVQYANDDRPPASTLNNIRQLVSPPDPLQPKRYPDRVEVKLDYKIDTKRNQTHYRIESYFFVPRSIGLDKYTYSTDEFFTDMNAFIRFKEPGIPAITLTDLNNKSSPLRQVCKLIDQAAGDLDSISQPKLGYELRMFGCIVRTNLRDVAIDVQNKMNRLDDSTAESVLGDDVRRGIERLLFDIDIQLNALRNIRDKFFQPKRPPWLSELFEYVDEYVGLGAEDCLTSVLMRIDAAPPAVQSSLQDLRLKIVTQIVSEQKHRQSAGYSRVVIDTDGDNRSFVHRMSALKKFMSSVLFLDIRKEEEGRRLTHLTAGMAAAVAMTFSTLTAIWARIAYGIDSFPFLVAIIIGYVFKDRIKDWLRTYFGHLVARRLYDYSVHICEPNTKTVLGRCRESFEFVPLSKVPSKVLHYRHHDSESVLEPETKSEVVMRYIKDVTLHGKRIAQFGTRLKNISDIHRFNISRFLTRMNEPEEAVASYSVEADRVVGVQCPKTYHVNLVVIRTGDVSPLTADRYRLILDKKGVKSLQFVETDRSDHRVHEHATRSGTYESGAQRPAGV